MVVKYNEYKPKALINLMVKINTPMFMYTVYTQFILYEVFECL